MLPTFVYGTLQVGFENHENTLKGLQYTAVPFKAKVGNIVHFKDFGYPGLYEGNGMVVGELIQFAAEDFENGLRKMDDLEEFFKEGDVNNMYDRKVKCYAGVEFYVYYCNHDKSLGIKVENGDWKTFVGKK